MNEGERLNPSAVTTCLEKKSHCHRLAACAFKNSPQLPLVGSIFGSIRSPRRMLSTFVRLVFTPSFFISPRIRVQPQPSFSRARRSTRSTISWAVRGRPSVCLLPAPGLGAPGVPNSFTHLRNVGYAATVSSALTPDPTA